MTTSMAKDVDAGRLEWSMRRTACGGDPVAHNATRRLRAPYTRDVRRSILHEQWARLLERVEQGGPSAADAAARAARMAERLERDDLHW